jgi:sterol desaturase/sphingolipid hydroxylase (fatty acid hydroxylase superfamily)
MTHTERDFLSFIAIPFAYSVGFFGWCYLREKMPIFSKRNARSKSTVVCGHIAVLLLLILLAQMAIDLYPWLPGWLTNQSLPGRHGMVSPFEYLCAISVLLVGLIEKLWIYVDSGIGHSASENDLT